jgi:hypothetical protein
MAGLRWIVIFLAGVAANANADETASTAAPNVLTRLPGDASLLRQLDGSAACATTEGIFVSVDDPHRWTPLPDLPRDAYTCEPVGGDRGRFLFADDKAPFHLPRAQELGPVRAGEYSLDVFDAIRKVALRGESVYNGKCAFASGDVGFIVFLPDPYGAPRVGAPVRQELLLTIHGGKTWKPALAPLGNQGTDRVSSLYWVSPTRLLVSVFVTPKSNPPDASIKADLGSVRLYELNRAGAFHRLWATAFRRAPDGFTPDGEGIWARNTTMGLYERLGLADGHPDAAVTVKTNWTVEGTAACDGCLLLWGTDDAAVPFNFKRWEAMPTASRAAAALALRDVDYCYVYVRSPKEGYVRRAKIKAPGVAGVLALKPPLFLVITRKGEGLQLDSGKGKLSVTSQ